MRKQEMSNEQLHQRNLMVEALTNAGWDGQQNDGFDANSYKYFEVDMNLVNGRGMRLHWRSEADKSVIYLTIQRTDIGDVLELHIYYGDKLLELLKTVTELQVDISPDNFRDHVRAIVKVCPRVLSAVGEEEQLVELTVDQYSPLLSNDNDAKE